MFGPSRDQMHDSANPWKDVVAVIAIFAFVILVFVLFVLNQKPA